MSIFFNIPRKQDPQKFFRETQKIDCKGSNRQKRDKRIGVKRLGNAKLLLKISRLNIREESGNIKPV